MSAEITPQFVYSLAKRNFLLVGLTLMLFAAIAFTATLYLPKKFKSRAVLEIYASYFQNPLVSDLISGTSDPSELRSQRSSLLRRTLTTEFLDSLGNDFGIYSNSTDPKIRSLERELLLQSIETFPLSSTSFQITVASNDPAKATDLTKAVLAHMVSFVENERHEKLLNTKNALTEHIRSLGVALSELTDAQATKSPEQLRSELEKVNADIEAMLKHYTSAHPEVASRINRAKELERMIGETPDTSKNPDEIYIPAGAKEPVKDVYHESLKKLSYLNIALDIEREGASNPHLSIIEEPVFPIAPFSPNKKLLLLFGVITGLVVSAVLVFTQEMKRGTFLSPEHVADSLGVPLLGKLPVLDNSPQKLIVHRRFPRALPLLAREG